MKILLAVDGSKHSEEAVESVLAQCARRGTEILVLHVAEPAAIFGYPLAVSQTQKKLSLGLVRRVGERLRAAGFQVKTLVTDGRAAEEIVDTAAEWRADLIVLGSHGRQGLKRFLLGEVCAAVARHADCSVQIVRALSARPGAKSVRESAAAAPGKPRKPSAAA